MCRFAGTTSFLLLGALGLLCLSSCSDEENNSLYDPNANYRPQPTITSVTPAGMAVAGMDTITVQGTNYSSVLAENSVFFNAQSAALLTASPTQITLKAPLVIGDSIGVRVAVSGSLLFSNTARYQLKAGLALFGALEANETSTSIATDATGNLYVGYAVNTIAAGVIKFTPAGARSTYAPTTPGVSLWTSFRMGPGGYLYGARYLRAIYRFTPGGGSGAELWVALPVGGTIYDIDFDQNGNLWAGGNNTSIYRVQSDKTVATFPFTGNVHSVRVYNGYLYFAAQTDAGEKIWRAQISAGNLGTPEVYFDFGAAYPNNVPLAITFSSDGVLYVGMDSPDGLLIVSAAKTYSAPFGAYKASFGTGLRYFAWGNTDDLYCSTANGALLRFTIRGKKSAPYYGSTM